MKLATIWLVALAAGTGNAAGVGKDEAPIAYNRQIRPILTENCFACHGPDSAARKAGLRLDQRAMAIEAGAIAPGDPNESEMIARIFAEVPRNRMPPPTSHKELREDQKELLRQWIAAGAEYQPHWSFIAPQRPGLPEVKSQAWTRNAIDRFVLSKLDAIGLQPAPEADRRTLARRVCLDLTGLPPTPSEVEALANDSAPDAYEKYVDRLLASPHWGEHRARYWLDAARYGDTHGLHFDNYREMWSYRDWVIEAFNRNQPFDQFTIEQLAGDLLSGRTLDQWVATGFNRCNITTNEGGTIPEENLVLYARDRTETTAQVWLGLTAGCAVCHDHKFDPLTQKEFYQMSAFFNNTTQGALDGNVKDTPPVVFTPRREDRPRWDALLVEQAATRGQLESRKQSARKDFDGWLAQGEPGRLSLPTANDQVHLHVPLSDGGGSTIAYELQGAAQTVVLKADAAWEPGHVAAKALRVTSESTLELGQAGDFEKDQAFSVGVWIKLAKDGQTGAVVARMDEEKGFAGWDLWLENGRVGCHIIHHWPEDALKVLGNVPVKAQQWRHVLVTYDGSGKAAGIKVFLDGELQATTTAADSLQNSVRTAVPLTVAQRHRSARLDDLTVQDLRVYRRLLSAEEAGQFARNTRVAWLASKPADQRPAQENDELYGWWLTSVDRVHQELSTRLAALEKEANEIQGRGTKAHVVEERTEPPKAYVLFRGEYDKRRDEVGASIPAFLPPLPPELPRNRLGFAQWLIRPEQPLMARVTVNRFWQEIFGAGIVQTAGDFGATGEMPSHPELLDWLAVEFRESGWDVKKLFRLMVTSATYRQAAVITREKLEKDPQNRFFSRGPRFRMEAEMVRDYALAASGLMVPKIGGPSVRPYQPAGVWEAVAMIGSDTRDYRQDHGESLYRRSMYTLWKRAAPPASMDIFNAPSREVCTVRRERTNTPLQALVTLNDPQFVEAARHLAQRALKEGGATQESRTQFMAERLLARSLRSDEIEVLRSSLDKLIGYYRAHEDAARQLLTVGESPADKELEAAQLAAWTMLANELMNLDEVLSK